MYERDVLMRQLTVFLERLSEFLSKKSIQTINKEDVEPFYSEMLEIERDRIVDLNLSDILEKFTAYEKLRILAELFYVEALSEQAIDRKKLAKKSLQLFHYLNEYTKTFDFDIMKKIDNLSLIMKCE